MKLDDLENARKAQKKSDRHFYFDDSGSIKYYGRASSDDYVEYHHAVLSYEQCKIIEEEGKSVNNFIVLIDPANEGVVKFFVYIISGLSYLINLTHVKKLKNMKYMPFIKFSSLFKPKK